MKSSPFPIHYYGVWLFYFTRISKLLLTFSSWTKRRAVPPGLSSGKSLIFMVTWIFNFKFSLLFHISLLIFRWTVSTNTNIRGTLPVYVNRGHVGQNRVRCSAQCSPVGRSICQRNGPLQLGRLCNSHRLISQLEHEPDSKQTVVPLISPSSLLLISRGNHQSVHFSPVDPEYVFWCCRLKSLENTTYACMSPRVVKGWICGGGFPSSKTFIEIARLVFVFHVGRAYLGWLTVSCGLNTRFMNHRIAPSNLSAGQLPSGPMRKPFHFTTIPLNTTTFWSLLLKSVDYNNGLGLLSSNCGYVF